jgi:hypothetical protein
MQITTSFVKVSILAKKLNEKLNEKFDFDVILILPSRRIISGCDYGA